MIFYCIFFRSCVEFLLQTTSEYCWNGKKFIWNLKPVIHAKYIDNYVKKLKKLKNNIPIFKEPIASQSNIKNNNKTPKTDKQKLKKVSGSTFTKQLNNLLRMIQPNEALLFTRINMIRQDIVEILKSTHPIDSTNVIPFGSSVSGLATIDSNIDLSLEINEINIKLIVHKIIDLLDDNPQIIDSITSNAVAKIPVIQFYHMPTKSNVDLSFNNSTKRDNANMIKFCVSLDSRIKTLYLIVKYWGKKLSLTGSVSTVDSYFVFMMVVFYVQQASVSLLPHFSLIKNLYSNWSYNPRFVETSRNCQMKMIDLLAGFFEYYSKFKFSANVICPINATAVRRRQFSTDNVELKYKLELNTACILDPLQDDTLVECNWSKKKLKSFSAACEEAFNKIQQSRSPESDKFLHFRKFFTKKTYDSLRRTKKAKS